MNKLILIIFVTLFSMKATYADEADHEAAYYAGIANTSQQISDALKHLEEDPIYQTAIHGVMQRTEDCQDLVLVRRISMQPLSREIIALCRPPSKTWSLESIDLISGKIKTKKIKGDLSELVLSLKTHSMIGDPGYVLTDATYAFITLRSDGTHYRHAVTCPSCFESNDSITSYRVLSKAVDRVFFLAKESTD